jgi:transcriptional regulator with XRE-family HTH domain
MTKTVNEEAKHEFLIRFGKHLKQKRQEKHLTQKEFVCRCNCDVKKVGPVECGEYDFKISSLLVLAGGLNISPFELLNFEFPNEIIDNFWINDSKP